MLMEEWLCVSLLDKCVNAFEHDVKMTLVAMEVPNLILNADGNKFLHFGPSFEKCREIKNQLLLCCLDLIFLHLQRVRFVQK